MKDGIKVEELGVMELLKLIYEEIKNVREELNEKIDAVHKELDKKIDAVYKELNEKIDIKFNYLDKKIDNTENTLVKDISEEFKTFYEVGQKRINNLEEKIDSEIEDRKIDVSKIKEFNRIIISDIRGRVSILEEESEKYNLN